MSWRRPTIGQRVYGAGVMLSALTVGLNYGLYTVKQFSAWSGLVVASWGFSTWSPAKRAKPPADDGT